MLSELPIEIQYQILEYLSVDDLLSLSFVSKDLRYLARTIKIRPSFCKRMVVCGNKYILNVSKYKVCELPDIPNEELEEIFRDKSIQCYVSERLEVFKYARKLVQFDKRITSIPPEFGNIKHLNLSKCTNIVDFSMLGNNEFLDVSNTNIEDISNLVNVKVLNINDCYGIKDIPVTCNNEEIIALNVNLKDVSNLVKVKKLTLSYELTEEILRMYEVDLEQEQEVYIPSLPGEVIRNINIFSNLEKLIINKYYLRIDLKLLQHIPDLTLNNCSNLENFEYLGKQHTLSLAGSNISNIQNLENVRDLNLSNCSDIIDFTYLGKQYKLNLSDTKIKDINNLVNVAHLNLCSCYYIIEFGCLGKQITLYLDGCKIGDISNLADVENLSLNNCINIYEFDCLGNQKKLYLAGTRIRDISRLGNIEYLGISNCIVITNFDSLGSNLKYLDASFTNISDVSKLSFVRELLLNYCNNVKDYDAIGKNQSRIELYASTIKNVSNLRFVDNLMLSSCEDLHDLSPLGYQCCLNVSSLIRTCDKRDSKHLEYLQSRIKEFHHIMLF